MGNSPVSTLKEKDNWGWGGGDYHSGIHGLSRVQDLSHSHINITQSRSRGQAGCTVKCSHPLTVPALTKQTPEQSEAIVRLQSEISKFISTDEIVGDDPLTSVFTYAAQLGKHFRSFKVVGRGI